jgi:hypothetical protein
VTATTVYESAPLPGERGYTVVLQLLLAMAGPRTEMRVDREQRFPHKTLTSTVVRVHEPSAGIEPLARAMTTVVHELERLHRQGYGLRERATGWRGAWHTDLVSPRGASAAMSWKIDLTKRAAEVMRLAERLAAHDVPVAAFNEPADDATTLAAMMRHHGAEARREHAVDALIAEDPTLSAGELVEELDRRGLLAPSDDAD